MPISWTAEADARLLVAILHTSESKPNHAAIARYMGPDCTPSAIQHRIQRLRDRAKLNNGDAAANDAVSTTGPAASPGTPNENSVSTAATATSESPGPMTPRKRGRPPKKKPEEASVSASEENGSPVKKQNTGENVKEENA